MIVTLGRFAAFAKAFALLASVQLPDPVLRFMDSHRTMDGEKLNVDITSTTC